MREKTAKVGNGWSGPQIEVQTQFFVWSDFPDQNFLLSDFPDGN